MNTIEESIVKGLMYNEEYARKVYPFLKREFFDGEHREVFDLYTELFDKYNKIPSMESMLVSVQSKGLLEDVFNSTVNLLQTVYKSKNEESDVQWLVDETEKYCIDKALFNAIYKSISIIEGSDKDFDKHAIPEILDEALSISFNDSVGSDYLEDFAHRFQHYTNPESRLRFPLEALNLLTNGGLPPKTLNALLASTNTGKSAMMCYLAGEWLKQGKNVLYISLEMSEEAVQERIDANLMNIKTDDLNNPNLDQSWFEGKIKDLKSKTLGKLIVKEYPTASAHSGHFKNLLRELQQKKKFKPDIVFIDYINICASSRYKSMSGVNSYSYIKAIAEELRGLACEFNLPIMTATQVNREGANSQSPDMTATSDSFGLPMSLDWFCAIVTNDELMEMGRQVLILLKTRYGNKQGKKSQIVKIDFDYMRYEDILEDDNQNKQIQSVVSVVSSKESVAGKLGSGIPNDINWD